MALTIAVAAILAVISNVTNIVTKLNNDVNIYVGEPIC